MSPDEIHALLDNAEPPFTIKTKGGRAYWIPARANIWTPEASRDMVCFALPGKGIVVLRVSAIEGVHIEHEFSRTR